MPGTAHQALAGASEESAGNGKSVIVCEAESEPLSANGRPTAFLIYWKPGNAPHESLGSLKSLPAASSGPGK